MKTIQIPLLRPNPPCLAELLPELREIERSRIFSNSGPVNTAFEHALRDTLFGGTGACVTVCNATLGLMLAIRAVLPPAATPAATSAAGSGPRLALMPAFTFAATAQAALWNGLEPLLCDSRISDWSADPDAEEALIAAHGARIAVIIPYATHGTAIDLDRYAALSRRTGIPVVVDAATSLGSTDARGVQFGTGSALPVVFSMHATKCFSTAEGGVIFCADAALAQRIRILANFGFENQRSASLFGLNAKLSEVHALLALARLRDFEAIMRRRHALAAQYRRELPGWGFQQAEQEAEQEAEQDGDRDGSRDGTACRSGCSFMPVLLPPHAARDRAAVIAELFARGIGAGAYFAPHLAQQPLFSACPRGPLPVADVLAARVLSLPIWDGLEPAAVTTICHALNQIVPAAPPSGSGSRPVVVRA